MMHHRIVGATLLAAVLVAGCSGGHSMPPFAGGAELAAKVASHTLNDTPQASKYRILHSFGSSTSGDGIWPGPGLVDVNGTFYGTASGGGKYANGAVYSISPTGSEKVVYSFAGTSGGDGSTPGPASSLLDVNGILYGTTMFGGKYNGGTVYRISRTGTEKVLNSFDKATGGGYTPTAALINVKGTLYGTTWSGGKYDNSTGQHGGVVFSVSRTTGTARTLHSFGHGHDGSVLWGRLLEVNGILFGVTLNGGIHSEGGQSYGTVFSITPTGTERVLHKFNGTDGAAPQDTSGLINVNGTLYGTTEFGGKYNLGTVFSISLTGAVRLLHSFGSSGTNPDGTSPIAGLTNVNGTLYGTTSSGGKYNQGTIFSISPTGTEQVLYGFRKGTDGSVPQGALLEVNGTLYGVTTHGGKNGNGTVFALTLTQ